MRIVCAPIGSGKTTAARQYVARSSGTSAFVQIREQAGVDCLVPWLASSPEEIVLDGLDRAAPAAVEAFVEFIALGKTSRRFIVLARSQRLLRAQALVARGLATLLDPPALNFDEEEISRLARALGVAHDEEDVAQLLHDTEGWPIAAEWILRDAASARRPLRGALETWSERWGQAFLEFVNAEGGQVETLGELQTYIRSGWMDAQESLEHMASLGFPIVRTRSLLRPHRLLTRLIGLAPVGAQGAGHLDTPTLSLKTLGRFRCSVGDHHVVFQRRRERNIFAFVAMAPEGRVTRQEILKAFWPDGSRGLATQGLRTALCRIRIALAQVVGADAVDRYFRTEKNEIRVNQSNVIVDVRRFIEHVQRGRTEDALAAHDAALHHYVVAERLYENPLFDSDAVEPCFLTRVEELGQMYAATLARLVELYAKGAQFARAASCARQLMNRSQNEELRGRAVMALSPREALTA